MASLKKVAIASPTRYTWPTMITTNLGMTDLAVSPIGMGTIQITRLPWDESIRVVRDVHSLGINWFDTAQGYLDSEVRLGEAFRGFRHQVHIITKSGAGHAQR